MCGIVTQKITNMVYLQITANTFGIITFGFISYIMYLTYKNMSNETDVYIDDIETQISTKINNMHNKLQTDYDKEFHRIHQRLQDITHHNTNMYEKFMSLFDIVSNEINTIKCRLDEQESTIYADRNEIIAKLDMHQNNILDIVNCSNNDTDEAYSRVQAQISVINNKLQNMISYPELEMESV